MNDRSPTTRSTRLAVQELEGQVTDVRPVVHDDALVAAQRPGQLAVTDVHGDDLRRPPTEQDVGEAPGAGARVECPSTGHHQPLRLEDVQRPGQLVPASGGIARVVGVVG